MLDRETAEAIDVAELYDDTMPQYLVDALNNIKDTFYIGAVNDQTLKGEKSETSINDVINQTISKGSHDGMMVFACDVKVGRTITRASAASLTRAFNKISCASPVVLIIRQGNLLSLSTCERMEYNQEWLRCRGEKLGRVAMLRDIDCRNPHRGHIDILRTIGEKQYTSFDKMYVHWMEVFSSELLTKQFYSELSDWYAWALNVVEFPNRLSLSYDNKNTPENTIRLLTRLVFVWFLKQKGLIPEELFNRQYIADNLIRGFDPDGRNNPETGYSNLDSTYYKAVLQNLFFAMLNKPCGLEKGQRIFGKGGMLYQSQLKNPTILLELANRSIPFLNSGLFDCLDYPDKNIYYDGFSEDSDIQDRLRVPDYLFFGESVGKNVDLSKWYDDKSKKQVKVRGIITILESYNFTVEENTPYDQEVSLDPELLGKIFENLLAAYNPETHKTARKQTGSFYTPIPIVHYLTESSIFRSLCNKCNDIDHEIIKRVVGYDDSPINLPLETRERLVRELYGLKIIDPACGSGAFPLSVLQQMVHILSKLDPHNRVWKAIQLETMATESNGRQEYTQKTDRVDVRDRIEATFNESSADADYARKLYIIKNCLYGVDIQPIAIQITQLRFFISLVVDQKGNNDPTQNFGIKPLPNIETKFIAADSLMHLTETPTEVQDSHYEELKRKYIEALNDLFSSEVPSDKEVRRDMAKMARNDFAQCLYRSGIINREGCYSIQCWDAYNVNASTSFYSSLAMFGISHFDIVIGNPPYGATMTEVQKASYRDMYTSTACESAMFFIEHGLSLLSASGIMSFIVPKSLTYASNYRNMRQMLLPQLVCVTDCGKAFEKVKLEQCIIIADKGFQSDFYDNYVLKQNNFNFKTCVRKSRVVEFGLLLNDVTSDEIEIAHKIVSKCNLYLERVASNTRGDGTLQHEISNVGNYSVIGGKEIDRIGIRNVKGFISHEIEGKGIIKENSLLFQNVVAHIMNPYPHVKLIGCIPDNLHCYITDTINQIQIDETYDIRVIWAILNSKLISWYTYTFIYGKAIRTMHFDSVATNRIPIILPTSKKWLISLVDKIRSRDITDERYAMLEESIDAIVYKAYGLSFTDAQIIDPCFTISREEYDNIIG